mmetsp:Transcript_1268/g.3288  ORF Transcript_1268/g.3288 Transcript_1268/m.3288 type:complete len:213 (+) Transcript_1268:884-1522(+)
MTCLMGTGARRTAITMRCLPAVTSWSPHTGSSSQPTIWRCSLSGDGAWLFLCAVLTLFMTLLLAVLFGGGWVVMWLCTMLAALFQLMSLFRICRAHAIITRAPCLPFFNVSELPLDAMRIGCPHIGSTDLFFVVEWVVTLGVAACGERRDVSWRCWLRSVLTAQPCFMRQCRLLWCSVCRLSLVVSPGRPGARQATNETHTIHTPVRLSEWL